MKRSRCWRAEPARHVAALVGAPSRPAWMTHPQITAFWCACTPLPFIAALCKTVSAHCAQVMRVGPRCTCCMQGLSLEHKATLLQRETPSVSRAQALYALEASDGDLSAAVAVLLELQESPTALKDAQQVGVPSHAALLQCRCTAHACVPLLQLSC